MQQYLMTTKIEKIPKIHFNCLPANITYHTFTSLSIIILQQQFSHRNSNQLSNLPRRCLLLKVNRLIYSHTLDFWWFGKTPQNEKFIEWITILPPLMARSERSELKMKQKDSYNIFSLLPVPDFSFFFRRENAKNARISFNNKKTLLYFFLGGFNFGTKEYLKACCNSYAFL